MLTLFDAYLIDLLQLLLVDLRLQLDSVQKDSELELDVVYRLGKVNQTVVIHDCSRALRVGGR